MTIQNIARIAAQRVKENRPLTQVMQEIKLEYSLTKSEYDAIYRCAYAYKFGE